MAAAPPPDVVTTVTVQATKLPAQHPDVVARLTKVMAEQHTPSKVFALSIDKKADAVKAYQQLIRDFPQSARRADALYALGVTQEELRVKVAQ